MSWAFTLLLLVAVAVWLLRRFGIGRGAATLDLGELPGLRARGGRVTFVEGRIEDVEGAVARNILHAFADIAAQQRLTGDVRILDGGELRFASTIPEGARQQLRNAYFAAASVH